MSSSKILLLGGTVLTHNDKKNVVPVKADLLITGNVISKIAPNISAPGARVIDCTNKIISPGFIDTHHHLWQTLLKGRHANEGFLEYMASGNFVSSLHAPTSIFYGQLAGALECIDAGTTTVVDHAHMNYSPEHSKAALAATLDAGIRSVFAYCPTSRLKSFKPFVIDQNMLEDWVMATLVELASKGPYGSGRVELGLAFDGLFLPKEVIKGVFDQAMSAGVKLITTHSVVSPYLPTDAIALLSSYDLLTSNILISHSNNIGPSSAALLKSTNSHISSTPSTELQMLGTPIALSAELDIQSQASIGIDCHSNNAGSLVNEMRLLLQSSRGNYNQKFHDAGKLPRKINVRVEEVFNLATLGGAKAISKSDQLGSLKEGYLADIAIFDALSPGMVCASQHDPVAAIVLHSAPGDVEYVIVDGVVRKEGGKLVPVDLDEGNEVWGQEKGVVGWSDIAAKLVTLRKELQKTIEGIDFSETWEGMIKGFYIDESKIVETL